MRGGMLLLFGGALTTAPAFVRFLFLISPLQSVLTDKVHSKRRIVNFFCFLCPSFLSSLICSHKTCACPNNYTLGLCGRRAGATPPRAAPRRSAPPTKNEIRRWACQRLAKTTEIKCMWRIRKELRPCFFQRRFFYASPFVLIDLWPLSTLDF